MSEQKWYAANWLKYDLTLEDARSADYIADAICRVHLPLSAEKAGGIAKMFSGKVKLYRYMLGESGSIIPVRHPNKKDWYVKLLNAKLFDSFWHELEQGDDGFGFEALTFDESLV